MQGDINERDEGKEVKRSRGQLLASAGLELTFCKGPGEKRRGVKGMLRPPQHSLPSLSLAPPLISPPAKQGSEGGREGGGVGDKNPDVPSFDGALPCQCILAFLPCSFCFSLPPNSNSTYFNVTNGEQNCENLELKH